jgi:hypothetical protein
MKPDKKFKEFNQEALDLLQQFRAGAAQGAPSPAPRRVQPGAVQPGAPKSKFSV